MAVFKNSRKVLIVVGLCGLSACASTTEKAFKDVSETASKTAEAVTTQDAPKNVESVGDTPTVGDVALTPLEDINIRKAEIPPLLLNMETPYARPKKISCSALAAEIETYDQLLGADFDDEDKETKSNETKALNVASSLVGSLIPFRGLVRTASGAASYDKEVERAYRKGVARRGFLKGLKESKNC